MTDATLNRFLASGTNANRLAFTPSPPTPASGPSPTYFWFETDTSDSYAWNFGGSAWVKVNTASGSGTVTSVATGAGLTGGPITTTGTVALAAIANQRVLANVSGGSLAPSATAFSALTGVGSALVWTTGRTITLTGDTTGVSGAFDGSGNLSFATTGVQAAKWTTGRTLALTGDVTYTSPSFDGSGNVTAAATVVNANVTATVTATGTPPTNAIGYLGAPQNPQNANYTTLMADCGKHLYHTSATPHTWTIDSNANVACPIGTALGFINENGGGAITLAITADILRWGALTGSRTLAANGTATALKVAATTWRLTGDGLT